MLTIRLSRFGKKKEPRYRVIISEKSKDPLGNYLESLGTYNPKTKEVKLETEKIKSYISKGAQTSDTVRNILISQGIIEGKKSNVTHINKKRIDKIKDTIAKAEAEKIQKEEATKLAAQAEAEAKKIEETPIQSATEEVVKEEVVKEEVVAVGENGTEEVAKE